MSYDPASSVPARRPHRRLWLGIGAAGVALALVCSVLVLAIPTPTTPDCTVTPPGTAQNGQTYVLAACGSSVVLGPDSYAVYVVQRFSDGETVLGTFAANATVGTYLLNSSEYSALSAQPHPTEPPPQFLWTGGSSATANLSVPVPGSPIQPYFVVENLHGSPASVVWTKTLSIYYTPTRNDASRLFPALTRPDSRRARAVAHEDRT